MILCYSKSNQRVLPEATPRVPCLIVHPATSVFLMTLGLFSGPAQLHNQLQKLFRLAYPAAVRGGFIYCFTAPQIDHNVGENNKKFELQLEWELCLVVIKVPGSIVSSTRSLRRATKREREKTGLNQQNNLGIMPLFCFYCSRTFVEATVSLWQWS